MWKLAGVLLAAMSLVCFRVALDFSWSIYQIARGNLGIAPGDWTKDVSPVWVVFGGSFLVLFIASIGAFVGWGAYSCLRPGGMFGWSPQKRAAEPWWTEAVHARRTRRAARASATRSPGGEEEAEPSDVK